MIQAALGVAALGMGAYSMFGPKEKPDYSGVTNQYNARNTQISEFAKNLASARARYMSSLNNMYNDAYSRFSGNAEAGFAGRGMSVSGGAFASALAKESGRMSFEGANIAAGMEREDLRSVDNAYGGNSGSYMSAISGGPGMQFGADREDMRSIGSFAGKLAMQYASSRGGGSSFRPGANVPGSIDNTQMGPSWNGWDN